MYLHSHVQYIAYNTILHLHNSLCKIKVTVYSEDAAEYVPW